MPLLGHPDTTVRRAYEVDQKKYDYHLITLDSLGRSVLAAVSDRQRLLELAASARAIATYAQAVAEVDDKQYETCGMMLTNITKQLKSKSKPLDHDRRRAKKNNESLLDVSDNGILGYIEIPKIKVSLPIYHGTDEGILQIAVGHIEGSSLPVGGPGTHAVLSGHRGLPSA